jgi:hypothetical protein
MAHNALNRHSRADRTLQADSDGNYTIMLSADVETNQENTNFLPIPEEEFYLIPRLHRPNEEMQSGAHQMPDLIPVSTP